MKTIRILLRSVRDSFKSVFRNFALSVASIACIIITLLVVALALVLSFNLNNFTEAVEDDLTIVAFASKSITEEELIELGEKIKTVENIATDENNNLLVTLKDKMVIRQEMIESSADYEIVLSNPMYDTRENNPLSDTFHVKVTSPEYMDVVANEIKNFENIDSVKYGEGMVEQLISVFTTIRQASLWTVGALILVTAFLIANTIKITIMSRKREIQIMRLVGSSNINIKIPFVLEGLFLGILGSIVPIVTTIMGYEKLYNTYSTQTISPFIQLIEPYPFTIFISTILLIIGVIVGMFGSANAVRKHLKI